MNKTVANKSSHSSASPTLAINEKVRQMWGEGQNVSHLGFGESRMPLHPRLAAALRESVFQKSYLDSAGLFELREKVASFHERYWGWPTTSDQIILSPGSKSLLFGIMLGFDCDVFLPTPSWVSYAPQAKLAGRACAYIAGSFDDDYEISIESLDAALERNGTGRTPLLILNSPNNPSGVILPATKLAEIANYCREKQIIVVSDEIYALTTFDGRRHRSIAEFYPEGSIIVGGPSKHLSLGGWRLGVAVLPDSMMGRMMQTVLKTVASEIWSSPTSAIQYAAIQAYSDAPEISDYIQACTDLHELKTQLLCKSLRQMGIRCTEPMGGFYFIANFDLWRSQLLQLGITSSQQLASYLLEKHELATLPGSAFGISDVELSLRIASSFVDMESDAKAERLMSMFLSSDRSLQKSDLPSSMLVIERFGEFIDSLNQR